MSDATEDRQKLPTPSPMWDDLGPAVAQSMLLGAEVRRSIAEFCAVAQGGNERPDA